MAKILGTLLPLNSLWSRKYGNDYFASAKLFIDWLAESGQSVWQMLPLAATSWKAWSRHFDSPYSGYGLGFNPMYLNEKENVVVSPELRREFMQGNEEWISEMAIFCAISDYEGTDDWRYWPDELKDRDRKALGAARGKLKDRTSLFSDQQIWLWRKFLDLRHYAHKRKVEIWGDIPFYLPVRNPLVWADREAFLLSQDSLEYVAGSPGGKHFTKRQVWGFPLYHFESNEGTKRALALWKKRVGFWAQIFDKCRLDAAVRFFEYEKLSLWDSGKDMRLPGPGEGFFAEVVNSAREKGMNVYIEDVSSLDMTKLHTAADKLGISGVSVTTMILGPNETVVDPIDFDLSFPRNDVYFSSSHDTLPLTAYLESLTSEQREIIGKLFSVVEGSGAEMNILVRNSLAAKVDVLIVAMQDWLGSRERINIPGVTDLRNWNYRMEIPVEDLPKKLP